MTRNNKSIKSNGRGVIDTLKSNIRHTSKPFDGSGYYFKTAITELKKEGLEIIYDNDKCRYYNKNTISPIYGYNQ